MRTIVLAASKGGVGKSTLAAALAVEASRSAAVAILDLDPQQSLARWHDVRSEVVEDDDETPPYLIEAGKRPEIALARAKRQKIDWLIVDTPGGSITRMKLAVDQADLVVIPVGPSPIDVESMHSIVELCELVGKPWVFVLNDVLPQSGMTDGARSYLETRFGNVLDLVVRHSESYPEAMLGGATAAETDKRGLVASEVKELWERIARLANNPIELRVSRNKRGSFSA